MAGKVSIDKDVIEDRFEPALHSSEIIVLSTVTITATCE